MLLLWPIFVTTVARSEWFWSPPKPVGDGPDYENLAFHLWQGDGFVLDYTDPEWQAPYRADRHDYQLQLSYPHRVIATGRPPLQPLVISAVYLTVGRNTWAFACVRLLLATSLAVAGALAVYFTARLLLPWGNPSLVLVGCSVTLAFTATHRTLRDYATDFLTEPLALLFMQIFVGLVCFGGLQAVTVRQRQLSVATAAGVFGVLILIRSLFVVWLPAVGLVIGLAQPRSLYPSWLGRWRLAAWFAVVVLAVCLPWWLRNAYVLQRWLPLGTQGPITLLGGYSAEAWQANGDWQAAPGLALQRALAATDEYQALANDTQREVMLAEAASLRVRQWLAGHWLDLPWMMAKRVYVHWNPYTGRSLLWKLACVLGVMGLIIDRQPAAWWLVGLLVISTVSVALLYSTGGRFLVPLYGVLYTLSGYGAAWSTRAVGRWWALARHSAN